MSRVDKERRRQEVREAEKALLDQRATPILEKPVELTDWDRKLYQEDLDSGEIRMSTKEDGSIQFGLYSHSIGEHKVFRDIDLDNGMLMADGVVNISDVPLFPEFIAFLHEVVSRSSKPAEPADRLA